MPKTSLRDYVTWELHGGGICWGGGWGGEHFGWDKKTIILVEDQFFWPSLKKDVWKVIKQWHTNWEKVLRKIWVYIHPYLFQLDLRKTWAWILCLHYQVHKMCLILYLWLTNFSGWCILYYLRSLQMPLLWLTCSLRRRFSYMDFQMLWFFIVMPRLWVTSGRPYGLN